MSRTIALVLLSVGLSGCREFLKVVVDDPHSLQPTFHFRSRRPLGATETVHLLMFSVSLKEDGREEVVWRIESRASLIGQQPVPKPPPLRQVQYGVAPEGFVTDVPPRPLAWGKKYRIDAALRVEGKESVAGAGGEFVPEAREAP